MLVLVGVLWLIIWAAFIHFGLHSYLVSAPESDDPSVRPIETWDTTPAPIESVQPMLPDVESAILHLLNEVRTQNRLSALDADDSLAALARNDADNMLAGAFRTFVHPDGSTLGERVARWSRFRLGKTSGLHSSVDTALDVPYEVALNVVKGWMNTTDAVAVLAHPGLSRAGIGVVQKDGAYVTVALLQEVLFCLDQAVPLSVQDDSAITLTGDYVGDVERDAIEISIVEQKRGFLTRYSFDRVPLLIDWNGDRFSISVPFSGSGMYYLDLRVGGEAFDRHPIRVH
jgi:uncharacterized protein YkwD